MLNGHLGVSRALGDYHFVDLKQPNANGGVIAGPLIADPDVRTHTLTSEDEFMLLACDGLWDVVSSQRAVEIARQGLREHNDPQQCAQQLVSEALRKYTADNVSVIAVCFSAEPPPKREFGIRQASTFRRSLSQGGLSTLSTALSTALGSTTAAGTKPSNV
jgi:protein phosphatase 2C family protein 2/3